MKIANKPIRVLLTTPSLNSTASPYRQVMGLAKYLPRDEFDLTICALRSHGHQEAAPILRELGVSSFVARMRPRGYTRHHIRSWIRDQKEIDSFGPFDIQHSYDFTSSPLEALMARLRPARRKFVYTQKNLNLGGHRTLLRLKALLSHRIISISDPTTALLMDLGVPSRKLSKILNGIDLEAVHSELATHASKQPGSILFVGHLEPRKRQDDAIRALAMLTDEMPFARLDFAGATYSREYLNRLQNLVERLGLADRVRFLGVRTDVLQLMQRAEAVLLCSENEGLPWVLVEAMAAGTPVVASNDEGSSMIVDHGRNGFLVPMGDVAGYAECLRTVLSHSSLAKRLTENGRRTVADRFSAERMVAEVAGVYRELAA